MATNWPYLGYNTTTNTTYAVPGRQAWQTDPTSNTVQIWYTWAATSLTTQTVNRTYTALPITQPTEQELAAAKKREEDKKNAELRAEELLKAHLREEQRKNYEENGFFLVHTRRGIYRVDKGFAGNIRFLGDKPDGQARDKYCIHPPYSLNLPIPDVLLTQKLLLEHNEAEFLRIANRTNP